LAERESLSPQAFPSPLRFPLGGLDQEDRENRFLSADGAIAYLLFTGSCSSLQHLPNIFFVRGHAIFAFLTLTCCEVPKSLQS
jgi:hypothetical protein